MEKETNFDNLHNVDYKDFYNTAVSNYNKQLLKNLSESTNLAGYQNQVTLNGNSKTIINCFGKLASRITDNAKECDKYSNCFTNQCTNVSLKIAKYIDKSKDIDFRIQRNSNADTQSRNLDDPYDYNLYEGSESTNAKIKNIVNKLIEKCDKNEANLVNAIEIKQQSIEYLKEQIENAKLRLLEINHLSQSFQKSSLDDAGEIITEDDIVNTKAALETLIKIGEKRGRLLENLCKKINIQLVDVDTIISQSKDYENQENITPNNDIENITSEIIQLLSKKIDEIKKDNEISRKSLIEKENEQNNLERKYNKITDEIKLFTF